MRRKEDLCDLLLLEDQILKNFLFGPNALTTYQLPAPLLTKEPTFFFLAKHIQSVPLIHQGLAGGLGWLAGCSPPARSHEVFLFGLLIVT